MNLLLLTMEKLNQRSRHGMDLLTMERLIHLKRLMLLPHQTPLLLPPWFPLPIVAWWTCLFCLSLLLCILYTWRRQTWPSLTQISSQIFHKSLSVKNCKWIVDNGQNQTREIYVTEKLHKVKCKWCNWKLVCVFFLAGSSVKIYLPFAGQH